MDDARVIDKNVEPTERFGREPNDLRGLGRIHSLEIGSHGAAFRPSPSIAPSVSSGLVASESQRIGPGGGKAEGDALADASRSAGDQGLATGQVERVRHFQYRFAMGRSWAGNRLMTSQPVSVTTTSSSMRAAEKPSLAGQEDSCANTMPVLISIGFSRLPRG